MRRSTRTVETLCFLALFAVPLLGMTGATVDEGQPVDGTQAVRREQPVDEGQAVDGDQTVRKEQPVDEKPWTAETAFEMIDLEAVAVSPDGRHLLFRRTETDLDANRRPSSIWILPTGGGEPRPLTSRDGSASSPRWSPDGDRIAYFDSGDEGIGLWVMRADGSGKRKVADLERSNAYLGWGDNVGNRLTWSPDGEALAYTAAGPRHYPEDPAPGRPPAGNDPMIIDRLLYKSVYYYSDLRRTHVWTVPVDGGEPRRITFGDYDYHSIAWSPDGEWIVSLSNRTGRDDFNANTDLCLVPPDADSGDELVRLTRTAGPEYQPRWAPDGDAIAYQGRVRSRRSKESDAELKKIYVLDVESRLEGRGSEDRRPAPVELTEPLDRWSHPPRWSADGRVVHFTADNAGKVPLYASPRAGGSVDAVVDERGQVTSFAVGPDGAIYYTFTDLTHPEEIYRVAPGGTAPEKLTAFNEGFLERWAVSDSERFTFRSFDGTRIEGWVMRPFDFEPGKKYPLILDVHGGPHGQYGYSLPRTRRLQLYAANGYAVAFTNPRGSTGYGQEFSDMVVGDIGGGDYQDLMLAVDTVLDRFPWVDGERMGVSGTSYGGYMTNWVTTHTDRFDAAVPISGISNLVSMWGTAANTLWFESDMGFMPYMDYERAWEVSPLKHVAGATTPTLFINGAWDFITPLYQSEEMYTALKKLGVEAVLAIYPDEGHGVVNQPRHTLDYYRRTVEWFDRHLKENR